MCYWAFDNDPHVQKRLLKINRNQKCIISIIQPSSSTFIKVCLILNRVTSGHLKISLFGKFKKILFVSCSKPLRLATTSLFWSRFGRIMICTFFKIEKKWANNSFFKILSNSYHTKFRKVKTSTLNFKKLINFHYLDF